MPSLAEAEGLARGLLAPSGGCWGHVHGVAGRAAELARVAKSDEEQHC